MTHKSSSLSHYFLPPFSILTFPSYQTLGATSLSLFYFSFGQVPAAYQLACPILLLDIFPEGGTHRKTEPQKLIATCSP